MTNRANRDRCALRFEGMNALRLLLASVATAPSILAPVGPVNAYG